jgi:hypothetical protein
MLVASATEAFPEIRRSSAKRRWWIALTLLAIRRPLMEPFLSSLNISLEKTSTPNMNKKGDRGSPCLNPLSGAKFPKGLPFKIIEKEVEEMHSLIQESQEELKPSFSMIERIKGHSILSKAFSLSILRNIYPSKE